MEEEKLLLSQQKNGREDVHLFSEEVYIRTDESEQGGEEIERENFPRISNSLSGTISTPYSFLKSSVRKELKKIGKSQNVGLQGKPVTLKSKEIEIIRALSYILSGYSQEAEFKEFVRQCEEGIIPKSAVLFKEIPLSRLVGILDGNSGGKKREQEQLYKRLQHISTIRQRQIYKGFFLDENDGKQNVYITAESPIIYVGERLSIKVGDKEENGVKIGFPRVFLEQYNTRYCPVLPKVFNLRIEGKDGRKKKISSDLFQNVLSYLESERGIHIYTYLRNEKKFVTDRFKQTRRIDSEEYKKEIRRAEKKALTLTLTVEQIKELTNTNYSDNRKMIAQFWTDLEETRRALVEYGIITEESRILREEKKVEFVYSQDFGKYIREDEEE